MERAEGGFTLIEVLVAMVIVATALVAMVGRLGASSDVQRTLALHTLMLDVALNRIERQRLQKTVSGDERDGTVEAGGVTLAWRLWSEKTEMDGFLRQNVAVRAPGEPELRLFLYRGVE
ncbi:MAG: type II secretion system protein GspI [Zetaproteobacteria bacterium]|nr:MAG: type II secretion system protein GspI [Zetaproteobacteria bacterium]